jgi:protein-disulfide isomerase
VALDRGGGCRDSAASPPGAVIGVASGRMTSWDRADAACGLEGHEWLPEQGVSGQTRSLGGGGGRCGGGIAMPGHERVVRWAQAAGRARASRRAQTARLACAAGRARVALRRSALGLRVAGVCAVVALVVVLVMLAVGQRGRVAPSAGAERLLRIQRHVAALFAGIPQHGVVLGQPTAPVTLQVFVDLEDGDGKLWFSEMLPPIIEKFVRTNVVRLELHSFKTNTLNRRPFFAQQVAALGAGAQNLLWNYAAMFFNEQGREYTNYVTEEFLTGIAKQVPDLNFAAWERSRTVAMARIVEADILNARKVGFHDTPAFRIGLTGGEMKNFVGRSLIFVHKYIVRKRPSGERYIAGISSEWQHPFSLVDAIDLTKAVDELI